MLMRYHLTDIFEIGFDLRHGRIGFHRTGSRLVNLVNPVGLYIMNNALPAAAPGHFEGHVLALASRKHAQGIRTGQIEAAAGHFLALHRHGPAQQFDLPADPLRVGRQTLQPHGNARRGAMVVVHAGGAAEVVQHDIQASVVVQISDGDAVVQRRLIESPGRPDILEFQVSKIMEGDDLIFKGFEQLVHLVKLLVLLFPG